jgi:DNA-binding response OmpR family regulator
MRHINRSILYIEDNYDTSDVVCFLLQQANFNVTLARNLEEGLKLLNETIFSLYLLGECRADANSLEVYQEICRKVRQVDQYSPILFYSSLIYETNMEDGIKVGTVGTYSYLLNPDDLFEIANTISVLLNKKRTNVQLDKQL